jgi:hypothetical protein
VHANGRKFAFLLKISLAAEEEQTSVSSTPSLSSNKPSVVTKESTNENGKLVDQVLVFNIKKYLVHICRLFMKNESIGLNQVVTEIIFLTE